MTVYRFDKQLNKGKAGEWVMDKYHDPFYSIQKATLSQEIGGGFDRFYRRNGKSYKVEVKTDYQCQKYGNLIAETISVDKDNKPGWSRTSTADVLIWYIWYFGEVLYFNMPNFKASIDGWIAKYGETAKIPNDTYNTIGIKLPVEVARGSTFATRTVDPYWMKENYIYWSDTNA